MNWQPYFWLAVLVMAEIVKFKAAFFLLQYWKFLR